MLRMNNDHRFLQGFYKRNLFQISYFQDISRKMFKPGIFFNPFHSSLKRYHTDLGLNSGNITGIACINWFTDPINQSVIEFSISGQSIYMHRKPYQKNLFKKFDILICQRIQGRRWIL